MVCMTEFEDGAGQRRERSAAALEFCEGFRRADLGRELEGLAVEAEQRAELGLADAHRILQHGLEHRFLARRGADDAQHLRRRGELLGCAQDFVLQAFDQLGECGRVGDLCGVIVRRTAGFRAGRARAVFGLADRFAVARPPVRPGRFMRSPAATAPLPAGWVKPGGCRDAM